MKGEGIHVLTVYPGRTDTPMMQTNRAGPELGFGREPASAVANATVEGIETDAFEVIRDGETRAQMIALNRDNPAAIDERMLTMKPMTVTAVREVFGVGRLRLDCLGLAAIRLIAPYVRLVTMQEIGQNLRIGDVGRGGHHGVDNFRPAVDPNRGLHAEVPLVAFLGLMHVGVARLAGILGGGRCVDDRRVHDCARDTFSPFASRCR